VRRDDRAAEGLSALTALQTLDLGGCQQLTGLPEGLSALTALQTLDLQECKRLTGLPEELSALTALQRLDLTFLPMDDRAGGGAIGGDGAAAGYEIL
jgi:predicted mannosyl-3-phosphoglycerate phosphatase (HAD superfamily)